MEACDLGLIACDYVVWSYVYGMLWWPNRYSILYNILYHASSQTVPCVSMLFQTVWVMRIIDPRHTRSGFRVPGSGIRAIQFDLPHTLFRTGRE